MNVYLTFFFLLENYFWVFCASKSVFEICFFFSCEKRDQNLLSNRSGTVRSNQYLFNKTSLMVQASRLLVLSVRNTSSSKSGSTRGLSVALYVSHFSPYLDFSQSSFVLCLRFFFFSNADFFFL